MSRTALVTGSAGFIGYFTSQALLAQGWNVIGLDAMTDYYDVELKKRRHEMLSESKNFTAVTERLETPGLLRDLFQQHKFDAVIHLVAQAGVRYSIDAPRSYVESNLVGTFELLEAARAFPPAHMLLASTSSVYGANTQMPYTENDKVDTQMLFYAATKKATEVMAHSYAHLYHLPITMFRFFTVYGPWGRPDMAHFKFTKAIIEGDPIEIYNHDKMKRDFTYIDDLVLGIVALIDAVPPMPDAGATPIENDSLSPVAPHRAVNIGTGSPVQLLDFVQPIETAMGIDAQKIFMDIQPGDVPGTWVEAGLLKSLTGEVPITPIETGIQAFVDWYREYYKV